MTDKQETIKITAGMNDPKGQLIPRGVQEQITIQISDEVASYWFKDSRVTRNFAYVEIEGDKAAGKEQTVFFIERAGKALKRYPGKKKEEIRDEILAQLEKLNVKGVKESDR